MVETEEGRWTVYRWSEEEFGLGDSTQNRQCGRCVCGATRWAVILTIRSNHGVYLEVSSRKTRTGKYHPIRLYPPTHLWPPSTPSQDSVCEEMICDLKFALMCQSSSKFVKPKVPPMPVPSPIAHSRVSRAHHHQPAPALSGHGGHGGHQDHHYYSYGQLDSTSSQQRLATSTVDNTPYCVSRDCPQHYDADHKSSQQLRRVPSRMDRKYRHLDDCALVKHSSLLSTGPKSTSSQQWRSSTRSVHYLTSGTDLLRGLTRTATRKHRPFNQTQSNSCSNLVGQDSVCGTNPVPVDSSSSSISVRKCISTGHSKRMPIKLHSQSLDDGDIIVTHNWTFLFFVTKPFASFFSCSLFFRMAFLTFTQIHLLYTKKIGRGRGLLDFTQTPPSRLLTFKCPDTHTYILAFAVTITVWTKKMLYKEKCYMSDEKNNCDVGPRGRGWKGQLDCRVRLISQTTVTVSVAQTMFSQQTIWHLFGVVMEKGHRFFWSRMFAHCLDGVNLTIDCLLVRTVETKKTVWLISNCD